MGICCMSQGTQTLALYQPRGVGWEGNMREVHEGGNICTPMADSCDVWQKTTKFCKTIVLQLKNNLKKNSP